MIRYHEGQHIIDLSTAPPALSAPYQGVSAALAFATVNLVCMVYLYGCAGRLTAKNGVVRPGQLEPADVPYLLRPKVHPVDTT